MSQTKECPRMNLYVIERVEGRTLNKLYVVANDANEALYKAGPGKIHKVELLYQDVII